MLTPVPSTKVQILTADAWHGQVIEQMSGDLLEMLGVVKTLVCLDARDHRQDLILNEPLCYYLNLYATK